MTCYNFHKVFYLLILLLVFTVENYSIGTASTVKGRVVEHVTGVPLEGVSVYFAGTTKGTISKKNGSYELYFTNSGNYEIVISMVGYYTIQKNEYLERDRDYEFNFELKQKDIPIKPIEIQGTDQSEWLENLEAFKKVLLGGFRGARYCEFLNDNNEMELINFIKDGKSLIAKSYRTLKVVNNYTGYRVEFELLNFEYIYSSRASAYSVIPRFYELKPKDEEQRIFWEENRAKTYDFSPEHFLWALRHNRLEQEGYEVLHVSNYKKSKTSQVFVYSVIEKWEDIKYQEQFSENPTLFFEKFLEIHHNDELLAHIYLRYNHFTIDSNGIADNHLPFLCYGEWGQRGIADLLPKDYIPPGRIKN